MLLNGTLEDLNCPKANMGKKRIWILIHHRVFEGAQTHLILSYLQVHIYTLVAPNLHLMVFSGVILSSEGKFSEPLSHTSYFHVFLSGRFVLWNLMERAATGRDVQVMRHPQWMWNSHFCPKMTAQLHRNDGCVHMCTGTTAGVCLCVCVMGVWTARHS